MATTRKGLMVDIGGNARPLNNALNEIKANVKLLEAEGKNLNAAFKLNPNLDTVTKMLDANKKAAKELENQLSVLKQGLENIERTGSDKNIAAIKSMETELQKVEAALKKVEFEGKKIEKLRLDNMSKDIELATDKADLLRDKLDMKFSFNTFGELQKTWQTALEKTSEKAAELRKIMAEMEKADPAVKQTAEFKELENQLTELENTAKSLDRDLNEMLGRTLRKAGVSVESFGKSLLPLSAGATAALTVATKMAIDQESAFAGVKKTVEASTEEYAALKQQLIELSEVIPLSATELMKIAESAGQLGIKKENIIGFTQVMADLGVATNLTGEEAASTFAKFANITQMPQENFSRLGSTVVALGNNSATTEKDIANMAMRLAGAGKQAEMTESQIVGLAAFLSSVGLEAEAGGSAYSRVITEIILAVETGKGKLKDFASVAGMSASQFQKAFKEDAASALFAFIQGLSRAKEEGGSAVQILDDMELSNIRINDALLRSSSAADLFAETMRISNQAWEENTALTKEAAERYGTTESKLIMTKNALENAAASIGEKLLPYLGLAADKVKDFAGWLDSLDDATKETIVQIGLWTAAIAPLLIGIGNVTKSVGTLFTLMGNHPIGAMITALGLLTAVTITYVSNVNTLSRELQKLNNDLEKIHESYNNEISALEKSASMKETQLTYTEKLIDKYDKLNKEVKTSSDSTEDLSKKKSELKSVVEQINRLLPDAIGKINEETGAYDTQTASVRNLVAEKRKMLEMQLNEEKAMAKIREQDEIRAKLPQAQEDYEKALRNYADRYGMTQHDKVAIQLGKYDFDNDAYSSLRKDYGNIIQSKQQDINTINAELLRLEDETQSLIEGTIAEQPDLIPVEDPDPEETTGTTSPDHYSAYINKALKDYNKNPSVEAAAKAFAMKSYATDEQLKAFDDINKKQVALMENAAQKDIIAAEGNAEKIKAIQEKLANDKFELERTYRGRNSTETIIAETNLLKTIENLNKEKPAKKEETEEEKRVKEYNARKKTLDLQYKAGDIKSNVEYYNQLQGIRDEYLTENTDEWLQSQTELNKLLEDIRGQGLKDYNEKKQRLELEYSLLDEEERDKEAHYNALLDLQQKYLAEGSDEYLKAQKELNSLKKELDRENIENYNKAVSDTKFESSFRITVDGAEAVEEYKRQADEIAKHRQEFLSEDVKAHKEAIMQSQMEEIALREKHKEGVKASYASDIADLDEKLSDGILSWEEYYRAIAKLREGYERDYKEKPEDNPVDFKGLDIHADANVYNARREEADTKFNDYDYKQDPTGETTQTERLGQYIQDLKNIYAEMGEYFEINKEEGKQLYLDIVNATGELNNIVFNEFITDLKTQLDEGLISFNDFKEQYLEKVRELYGEKSKEMETAEAYIKKTEDDINNSRIKEYDKLCRELKWMYDNDFISYTEYLANLEKATNNYLVKNSDKWKTEMQNIYSMRRENEQKILAEAERAAEQAAKARADAEKAERSRLEKERQEKVNELAKEKEAELKAAQDAAKRASEAATAAEKKKLDEEKSILNERIKNIDAEIKKIRELSSARSEQEAMDKLKKQLAVAEAEYKNARLDEHGDDFDIENKRLEVERLRQELTKAEQNAAENAIVKALEEEKVVLQEQIRTLEDSASAIKNEINAAASGMTEDIRQIALEWAESQVPPVTEEEIKNAVVEAIAASGIGAGYSESTGGSSGSGVSYGSEYSSKVPGVSVAGAEMLERVARSLGHTLDSYMASEGAKADARRAAEAAKSVVNHYDTTINANGLTAQEAGRLIDTKINDNNKKQFG